MICDSKQIIFMKDIKKYPSKLFIIIIIIIY